MGIRFRVGEQVREAQAGGVVWVERCFKGWEQVFDVYAPEGRGGVGAMEFEAGDKEELLQYSIQAVFVWDRCPGG